MSHSPPIPAGNQSPYPIQEPPHVKRETVARAPAPEARRSRWTLLPILTASVSVTATIGAAAILFLSPRNAQDN